MIKTYCVKQRKKTDCVSGSERYERTKNNRLMLKCVCIECNNVKTSFVSEKKGKGIKDVAGPIKQAWDVSQKGVEMLFPTTKQNFADFWSGKLAKDTVGKHGIFSKELWTDRLDKSTTKGNLKDCAFALPMQNGKLRYYRCKK